MATQKRVNYRITAEEKDAVSGFNAVGAASVATGTFIADMALKAVGALKDLAVQGFKFAIDSALEFARVQQIAERDLEKVFGKQAEHFKQVAKEIQATTNVGDELAITFTTKLGRAIGAENVRGSLIKGLVDLNAHMGRNPDSLLPQTKLISQAINTGLVTSLQGMGIQLDDTAFKAADTAGRVAQLEVALKGVEGAAEAQADPFKQLTNAFGDLREKLGEGLIDDLDKLANDVIAVLTSDETIENARALGDALGDIVRDFTTILNGFLQATNWVAASTRQDYRIIGAALAATNPADLTNARLLAAEAYLQGGSLTRPRTTPQEGVFEDSALAALPGAKRLAAMIANLLPKDGEDAPQYRRRLASFDTSQAFHDPQGVTPAGLEEFGGPEIELRTLGEIGEQTERNLLLDSERLLISQQIADANQRANLSMIQSVEFAKQRLISEAKYGQLRKDNVKIIIKGLIRELAVTSGIALLRGFIAGITGGASEKLFGSIKKVLSGGGGGLVSVGQGFGQNIGSFFGGGGTSQSVAAAPGPIINVALNVDGSEIARTYVRTDKNNNAIHTGSVL